MDMHVLVDRGRPKGAAGASVPETNAYVRDGQAYATRRRQTTATYTQAQAQAHVRKKRCVGLDLRRWCRPDRSRTYARTRARRTAVRTLPNWHGKQPAGGSTPLLDHACTTTALGRSTETGGGSIGERISSLWRLSSDPPLITQDKAL